MGYDIRELIPHREPMLFIDEIVDASPGDDNGVGNFIKTRKIFAVDDPIFKGHFPKHPILPGVFGLENLAQSGAALVNITCNKTANETIFLFMTVEDCKFRRGIYPQDVLETQVKISKRRGEIFRFTGEITVNGKVATQANFTAKVEVL